MTARNAQSALGTTLVVVLVAIAAILGACSTSAPPRFPHRVHLAGLECGHPGQPTCLRCNGCHTPSGLDRVHGLPDVSLCDRCHRSESTEMSRVVATRLERPDGEITFTHARHLALAGIDGQCVTCHAGVVEKNAPDVPPMKKCLSCHEHEAQWRRGECTPCHARTDLVRLMPRTFLRHEGDFIRRHGQAAVEQKKLCQSCHEEADCDGCHDVTQGLSIEKRRPEAIDRSFVHRGDFLARHPMEAQAEPARCLSCHEPASCDACHVERGVSGNGVNGRNPHPVGWVSGEAGSRNFHGTVARRDVALCASCHDQGPATNCILCHKVGAYGGNPHPPGFRSSQSRTEGMCRYCHE
jgi:hypothetical protein